MWVRHVLLVYFVVDWCPRSLGCLACAAAGCGTSLGVLLGPMNMAGIILCLALVLVDGDVRDTLKQVELGDIYGVYLLYQFLFLHGRIE